MATGDATSRMDAQSLSGYTSPSQDCSIPAFQHSQMSPVRHWAASFSGPFSMSQRSERQDIYDAPATQRQASQALRCRDQDRPRRSLPVAHPSSGDASAATTSRRRADQGEPLQNLVETLPGPFAASLLSDPDMMAEETSSLPEDSQHASKQLKRSFEDLEPPAQPAKRMRLSLSSLAAALPCPSKPAAACGLSSRSWSTLDALDLHSSLAFTAAAKANSKAVQADTWAAGKRNRLFDLASHAITGPCFTLGSVNARSPKRVRL